MFEKRPSVVFVEKDIHKGMPVLLTVDGVAMAPGADGLASPPPSPPVCSIPTSRWLRASVSKCGFAGTNEGHYEQEHIRHISRGRQNHEMWVEVSSGNQNVVYAGKKYHMKWAPVGICDFTFFFFSLHDFSNQEAQSSSWVNECCWVIHEHSKPATVHLAACWRTSADLSMSVGGGGDSLWALLDPNCWTLPLTLWSTTQCASGESVTNVCKVHDFSILKTRLNKVQFKVWGGGSNRRSVGPSLR